MIKNDLSNLPGPERPTGNPPAPGAEFAPLLAKAWADTVDREELAFALDTRIRNSWAGKCARQMSYMIQRAEPSNPMDYASYWTFGIGTAIHEMWQAVIQDAFPTAEVEVTVDMRPHGLDASGHIDLVVTFTECPYDGHVIAPVAACPVCSGIAEKGNYVIAIELKSINGFGFKMSVGARGPAEGPRWSAIVQGSLNGLGMNADEVRIIYLSLENLSPREMDKQGWDQPWQRFSAEWIYTREEYEGIAKAEIGRMNRILEYVDDDKLAPRQIPDPNIPPKARVTDPYTGAWQLERDGQIIDAGKTWMCGYCSFQDRCVQDGPTVEAAATE